MCVCLDLCDSEWGGSGPPTDKLKDGVGQGHPPSSTHGHGQGRSIVQIYDKGALCVRQGQATNTVGQIKSLPKRATQVGSFVRSLVDLLPSKSNDLYRSSLFTINYILTEHLTRCKKTSQLNHLLSLSVVRFIFLAHPTSRFWMWRRRRSASTSCR